MLDDDKNQKNLGNSEKTAFGVIKNQDVESEMKTAYLDYAMSVIVSRALPDVRDGLKPVHRRILYAMKGLGLFSRAKFRKCATVVGEVLGKFHPHGDIAVYDALVRMAQNFSMRYPLINGQGNYGSVDGDSAAAMRYTEAKMAPIAEELLTDLEKNTVSFMDNYDGTNREPTVLPARVPNLLLNGTMGIAVGMATNIPPHNLQEVVDATIALIKNPETTIEELLGHIKGPDFPTGGIIYDYNEIREAYQTGKGRIVIRGVAEIVENEKIGRKQIIISEIPYSVNKSTLVSKIADLVKLKKIDGIADLRDESDRKGIRVAIDLKRDAFAQKILNVLYKYTSLQETFHLNMLALVDGLLPRVLNLKMVLENWISHRKEVVTRRCDFDLSRAKERAHILEGLKIALNHLDEVIQTIKKSAGRDEALKNLIKKFKLTEIQGNAILDMRLASLSALERKKVDDELDQKKKEIAYFEDVLTHPAKILEIVKNELEEIKQRYGDKRRTKVIRGALGTLGDSDLIPNEDVIVTITTSNYVKRIPTAVYHSQARGGKGVIGMGMNEEDRVEYLLAASNLKNVLFFTNFGRVFKTKVYEIPAASRIAKGIALVNLIQLRPNESIQGVITASETQTGYLFLASRKGIVKKTALSEYKNVGKSGIITIKLDANDELAWVKLTKGDDDIALVTQNGLSIRFNEKDVRPMRRATRGVKGIRLSPSDQVVGMGIAEKDKDVLIVSENGLGKRTPVRLYKTQTRGGKGVITQRVNEKTGKVKAVEIADTNVKDVILVSKSGQIIRIPYRRISISGRATQGVKLMRLNKNDKVASMTCIYKEDEEEPPEKTPPKSLKKPKPRAKKQVKKQRVKIKTYQAIKSSPSVKIPKVKVKTYSMPLFIKKSLKKKTAPKKTPEILKEASSSSTTLKKGANYWGTDKSVWRKKP